MKTIKTKNSFTRYQNIIEDAIKSNLLTNEELKSSELYIDYWLASYSVSTTVVHGNFDKIQSLGETIGYDFDDFVHDMLSLLIHTYSTLINAIIHSENNDFNYKGYCHAIFRNYIITLANKSTITQKTQSTDCNGIVHNRSVPLKAKSAYDDSIVKVHYTFTYSSAK